MSQPTFQHIPPHLAAEVEQRLSSASVNADEAETSLDGDSVVAAALLWLCLPQPANTDT